MHWGEALDLFMMVVESAEELGIRFDREHPPLDESGSIPYTTPLGLHVRACQSAVEVYHLLRDGLPKDALARSRTLHGLAGTAIVLADYRYLALWHRLTKVDAYSEAFMPPRALRRLPNP